MHCSPRIIRLSLLAGLVVWWSGCVDQQPPRPNPTGQTPPAVPVAGLEGELRAGDEIQVRIDTGGSGTARTGPEMHNVTVSEEGEISLPLIGRVSALGLTPAALAERIEANYVPRYYVRCTVAVTAAARYFYVGGEVRGPGRFNWTEDMTLLKAINTAGSFTDYANRRKVEIARGKEKIVVDLEALRRNPEKDIPIRPGDSLWIPRSIF